MSLRARLQSGKILVAPGAYDALTARLLEQAGFEAVYRGGYAASAAAFALPDLGITTLTDMVDHARRMTSAITVPVIADADTGYGEVECCVRTVVEYERAGAAALHVEDQIFPKRCGHLDGKALISAAAMVDKVRAMANYRVNPDFVIIARTDAVHVTGFGDAVTRANLYREAGADMIFPEGLQTEKEFAEFAKASPGPLLANMTEFGKTADISAERFQELGYQVVIYPLSMMRLAMGEVTRGLAALKRDGSVRESLPRMQTRKELYELLAYTPGEQWNFPNDR